MGFLQRNHLGPSPELRRTNMVFGRTVKLVLANAEHANCMHWWNAYVYSRAVRFNDKRNLNTRFPKPLMSMSLIFNYHPIMPDDSQCEIC